MSKMAFGAKPAVLRCSRCGRFVDWEEARLQIVCACRPPLKVPVVVREGRPEDVPAVAEMFMRDFGHTNIVAFGEPITLGDHQTIVAETRGELAGALAHRAWKGALQILALATDPMWQRSGIGSAMLAEIEALARREAAGELVVSTTNDNLPALYFYQRAGFCIFEVVPQGMLQHHRVPGATGFGGIPVRDEIRLRKRLAT